MKIIGCPSCGELFPVEVIMEDSKGKRTVIRCEDAYHKRPTRSGLEPKGNE